MTTSDNLDQDAPKIASDVFGKLLQGLRSAIEGFQSEATPENLGKVVTAIGAYGISSSKLWKDVANFARRHPVQTAIGASLAFYALRGVLGRSGNVNGTDPNDDEKSPQWRTQNYH